MTIRIGTTLPNKYAVIVNGTVSNFISWDGITPYGYNNTLIQALSDIQLGDTYSDNIFSYSQPLVTQAELLKALSAHRDYVAEGGMSIDGINIQTDTISRANLMGAYLMAQLSPSSTFDWDTTTGYVTLTGQQILALSPAVGAFIQKCFTVGKTLADNIGSYSDIPTLLDAFDTAMKL